MRWQIKFGYTILIMLIGVSVAAAVTIVNEEGDAGSLLDTAQRVDQNADDTDLLLEIRGSIIPGNDEDMYRIEISLPSLFSANTNLLGSFIEDTRLFLFDENGNGICANHDNPNALPGDPNASRAVLPPNGCLIPPGTYFIAISTFQRFPVFIADNPGSRIFPDTPRNEVVGPLPSVEPIQGWVGTGQRGDAYIIRLTGVNLPPPDDCVFVGETINGQTKTLEYLAQDLNLGIASVNVGALNLIVDQEASDPDPMVLVPLGPNDVEELAAGESLPIDPPRDQVTFEIVNPNRFADLEAEVTVTNSVGGTRVCAFNLQRDSEPNAPFCSGPQIIEGEPQPTLEEVAQDAESGIQRIRVLFIKNATLTIDGRPAGYEDLNANPPIRNPIVFDPPTTREIVIRAVKIDETKRATVLVRIFDNNISGANTSDCDPHILHFIMPPGQFVLREHVPGLREVDQHVTISNGDPGTTLAAVRANEGELHARRLYDQEEGWINTADDMVDGNDNTMAVTAIGLPGSEAIVVIADRPSGQSVVVSAPQQSAVTSDLPVKRSSKPQDVDHNWGSR